jgi:hypothetical protein
VPPFDLSGKQLIGEVRILNLVGAKSSYGRLIAGDARGRHCGQARHGIPCTGESFIGVNASLELR